MSKKSLSKPKPKTTLWYIGIWATIWWAFSGLYFAVIVWESRGLYVQYSLGNLTNVFHDWVKAISSTFDASYVLKSTLIIIVVVWLVGFIFWLIALKKQTISYRLAFRDLLFTVRK